MALCDLLQEYFTGKTYEPTQDIVGEAVAAQRAIGLQYLPQGIFAIQWRHALESRSCDHADRKLASFIYMMWTEIVDKIWRARNEIVHHGNNLNRQVDESHIDRRLRWYKDHHQDILAHQDFNLTAYDLCELHILTLASKREHLRQLDIAKKRYSIETQLWAKGQRVITQYFSSTKQVTLAPCSGVAQLRPCRPGNSIIYIHDVDGDC